MSRSLQARMTRKAISPRLATRIRWNMQSTCGLDLEQFRAVLDRLAVLDQRLDDDAAALGLDLVEDFHSLDEADHRGGSDALDDLDIRLGVGFLAAVEGPGRGALDLVPGSCRGLGCGRRPGADGPR